MSLGPWIVKENGDGTVTIPLRRVRETAEDGRRL